MKLSDLVEEVEIIKEGSLVKVASKVEAIFKKIYGKKSGKKDSILLCLDKSGSMIGKDIIAAMKKAMDSAGGAAAGFAAAKDDSLLGMMTLDSKLFSYKTADAWRREVKSKGFSGGSDFSLFKKRAQKFDRAILITDDDADFGETKKQLSGIKNLTIIKA